LLARLPVSWQTRDMTLYPWMTTGWLLSKVLLKLPW